MYLVDSIDLSTLGSEDRSLLTSTIKKFHAAQNDEEKSELINILVSEINDESTWVAYNKWLDHFLKSEYKGDGYLKKKLLSAVENNFGVIEQYNGRIQKAMSHYLSAVKISEEIADSVQLGHSYMNIASLLNSMEDERKALDYLQISEQIFKPLNDTFSLGEVYNNKGFSYSGLNIRDSAILFYEKAMHIYTELDDEFYQALIMNNLAKEYEDLGKHKIALSYYFKSSEISLKMKDPTGISSTFNNIANSYLMSGNAKKAREYGLKAHQYSIQSGHPDNIRSTANILFRIESKLKNWKDAFEYQSLYHLMNDSLKNLDNNKALLEQQYAHEYAKSKAVDSTRFANEKKVANAQRKADLAKLNLQESEIQSSKYQKIALFGGLGLILVFAVFIFNRLRVSRKQNVIIQEQRDLAHIQKVMVEDKNKEILDSINYAKRLQEAILPSAHVVEKYLKNNFLLYQPKDIIAGDFYWLEHVPGNEDEIWFAVADCTGHGVPGAMVSVVCANALNRAFHEFELREPGEILDQVKKFVIKSFDKSDEEIKDGMDIGLCKIDFKTNKIAYAGANNPLYIVKKRGDLDNKYVSKDSSLELQEVKGTKQPIGKYEFNLSFETNYEQLESGDTIYLSTDGFPDQFGGPKGKKFKYANFKRLLLNNANKPLKEQKSIIQRAFNDWKGEVDQVDDICVIGVRVE